MIRGNLLGYENLSNVWKDMGLQKRITEKEKGPDLVPSMQLYYVISLPSSYEEAEERKEWKDAMIEEYQSIMKNDVWDVVPRTEGKSMSPT